MDIHELIEIGTALASINVFQSARTVQALHAEFHRVTAGVLDLALSGHRPEAEAQTGRSSAFAQTSASLTTAMMQWKASLLKRIGSAA